MKRIYIDMDGVLCNFYDAAKEFIKKNPDVKYPQSKIGFFLNLKEMPNAIDSFNKLKKDYDVWILTRPSFRNINCYSEKAQWVENNLGYDVLKKTIFSGDKSLLKGDYLIDDQLNANQDKFEGKLIRFGSDEFKNWNKVLDFFNNCNKSEKEEFKLKVEIEDFDYEKYLSLYEETNDDKYKQILISRIISVQSQLTSLIVKYRHKPSDDDGYKKYRDELQIIRKKLKLI